MMKTEDIRKLSVRQLLEELTRLMKLQFFKRIHKTTKQLVKTHEFTEVRRQIARVKTILHEKKSFESVGLEDPEGKS